MKVQNARTLFEACPLCSESSFIPVREAEAQAHPQWFDALEPSNQWKGCTNCGHLFADGYFEGEIAERVLAGGMEPTSTPDLEMARHFSAQIVERVSSVRGAIGGRWLDVGFGNGSLLATADEFGYEAVGVDLRERRVAPMAELGYDARHADFLQFEDDEGFDVVSFCEVLERMPFPNEAIAKAKELMPNGGHLFLSTPNVNSHAWKLMDKGNENPYWSEIEQLHAFSREHAYYLLGQHGFSPVHFTVGKRFRAEMAIVAEWRPEDSAE